MPSTRRTFLTSAVAGSLALAGCSALSRTATSTPEPDDPPPSGVDELPDPDNHIFGATGNWSSFGCNAANTRVVADGKAPVDGVTESWRAEVAQTSFREPVVADGRVYHSGPGELRVFDAADGTELWTLRYPSTPGKAETPILRDDVVYTGVGNTLYALEPATGDALWEREFDKEVTLVTHTTRGLVCGVGEEVVSLEPDDGTVQWRRKVFGRVLKHAAMYGMAGIVVATEAGMVYLLGNYGGSGWRWQLPEPPMCPPIGGREAIYISCQDGSTYALAPREAEPTWTAETSWIEDGIGLVDGIVLGVGAEELHALDAESGDRYWTYSTGNWTRTAPAYGRDTVFVGGDRLRALDPTPGDDPANGPALRFEREFAGRVGPGPVLDDGVLYVIADVEEEEYALLALE